MKFVREIPKARIKEGQLHDLEQFGFTLIDKEDSVEVWVEEAVAV